jgi:SAM-dependent methyltransferase
MKSRTCVSPMALGVAGLLAVALTGAASARDRTDCERDFKPQVGQSGKDVIWVPTPDEQVQRMLQMAQVTPQDVVYDLGAGDGKIAIAAGKLGARAVGIEFNPAMARFASCLVEAEGVSDKTRIVQGDIFKEDFSRATVVTMYLLPELNLCVRHRLLAMRPGTRVASYQFGMGDWKPDETLGLYGSAFLWVVPARVDGIWALRDGRKAPVTIDLAQDFQSIRGEVDGGASRQPLADAVLRGDQVRFTYQDDLGVTRKFSGTVRGDELAGTLHDGTSESRVVATLQGDLRPAAWAAMQPQCAGYYGGQAVTSASHLDKNLRRSSDHHLDTGRERHGAIRPRG